jgi:RNA polymerase sigma-70 factor (ECF subfamily)
VPVSTVHRLEPALADLDVERWLPPGPVTGTRSGRWSPPHLRALHVHCYRMLGSYADAEEAVQEATVRAWRGLAGYQVTGPMRHWLSTGSPPPPA